MTFAEKLVHYRTNKNMTQKALAEALDITPTRLNYWEKGKREPDIQMIGQLAKILDVSANVLIGLEEETKKSPMPEGTEDGVVSLERATAALVAMGYIREGDQLSDDDLAFFTHVMGLLDAWFRAEEH